jgi:hypothetical protein
MAMYLNFILGRWYILDGALNLIYFVVFLAIIMLWRPTDNNERYGLHQITDFDPDIGKLSVSLDEQGMHRDEIELDNTLREHMDEDVDVLEETADEIFQWVEDSIQFLIPDVKAEPFEVEEILNGASQTRFK